MRLSLYPGEHNVNESESIMKLAAVWRVTRASSQVLLLHPGQPLGLLRHKAHDKVLIVLQLLPFSGKANFPIYRRNSLKQRKTLLLVHNCICMIYVFICRADLTA